MEVAIAAEALELLAQLALLPEKPRAVSQSPDTQPYGGETQGLRQGTPKTVFLFRGADDFEAVVECGFGQQPSKGRFCGRWRVRGGVQRVGGAASCIGYRAHGVGQLPVSFHRVLHRFLRHSPPFLIGGLPSHFCSFFSVFFFSADDGTRLLGQHRQEAAAQYI